MISASPSAWSVSVVAFGEPTDPHTFSGYAPHLTRALDRTGHLRRTFSAKLVRPLDALRGAVRLYRSERGLRPCVSNPWLWSGGGDEVLSQRLDRAIRLQADTGPFLQVGTLVRIDETHGPHYMLTDMTVPQAHRGGFFAGKGLHGRRLRKAHETQARRFAEAAHIFTLSEWAARSVREDFGVPGSRVTVVYAGPNLPVPDGLGAERRPHEILFVGWPWEPKGGPLLLDAFRLVRRRIADATLRVVGCSPSCDVAGVTTEGFLNRRDPAQYRRLIECYLSAGCFCLPSLLDAFPNAIIEAASVGLPTVAIATGSRPEAVLDGLTGRLVAEPTPEALAEALCELLDDPSRCRTMGEAARRRAAALFTWDRVVERIGGAVAGVGACEAAAR